MYGARYVKGNKMFLRCEALNVVFGVWIITTDGYINSAHKGV
jgi:hypothetical protein